MGIMSLAIIRHETSMTKISLVSPVSIISPQLAFPQYHQSTEKTTKLLAHGPNLITMGINTTYDPISPLTVQLSNIGGSRSNITTHIFKYVQKS